MSEVVKLYQPDAAKDPNMVLEQAVGKYNHLLILGWDKEGRLDVRADLGFTQANVLWVIEHFKHKLLSGDYDSE